MNNKISLEENAADKENNVRYYFISYFSRYQEIVQAHLKIK